MTGSGRFVVRTEVLLTVAQGLSERLVGVSDLDDARHPVVQEDLGALLDSTGEDHHWHTGGRRDRGDSGGGLPVDRLGVHGPLAGEYPIGAGDRVREPHRVGDEVDEIVLIADPKEPRIALVNEAEGYRVAVEWDPKYLQNAMLWISNRGRKGLPWGGTNLCLGVEPITSAFDFGQGVSANENPLRKAGYSTAIDFEAGRTYEVRHRIAGEGIG